MVKKAIAKYGVGGKTSAGYGYFKDIHDEQAITSASYTPELVATPSSSPTPLQQAKPIERIRPNIPAFRAGQDIKGNVIAPTDEIRQRVPEGTTAFLSYESFPTRDVLIIINAEEAKNWTPGQMRICLFVREEVKNGTTLLICQPRPPKDKDKKKR